MTRDNTQSSRRCFLAGAAAVGTIGSFGLMPTKGVASDATSNDGQRSFREVTSFRVEATRARKIATSADRVYVGADRNVRVYDLTGTSLATTELPRPVRCLDVSPGGRLHVGTMHEIHVFDMSGRRVASWEDFGKESILSDIATSKNEVFTADAGNHVIWRLDHEGKRLGEIANAKQEFNPPTSFFTIASTSAGLHVANPRRHHIETYDEDGRQVASWGQRSRSLSGFSGCCNPVSFVVLPTGEFVTAERGQPRVKLFGADGKFKQLIADISDFSENSKVAASDNGLGCNTGGFDLAVGDSGQVVLLDCATNEVRVYSQL